jgi:hypothetical protein
VRQARIDRPADKRRASHPLLKAAFRVASLLWQPRLAQALDDALSWDKKHNVVALDGLEGIVDQRSGTPNSLHVSTILASIAGAYPNSRAVRMLNPGSSSSARTQANLASSMCPASASAVA